MEVYEIMSMIEYNHRFLRRHESYSKLMKLFSDLENASKRVENVTEGSVSPSGGIGDDKGGSERMKTSTTAYTSPGNSTCATCCCDLASVIRYGFEYILVPLKLCRIDNEFKYEAPIDFECGDRGRARLLSDEVSSRIG